ncbi:hypothetical protein [Pseudomonas phage LUZ7]|uniref:Uncharacterized protein n=1 Tax=Pseudomonas phage LUZ7 TaxID=655097 RepID=C8ZKB2_9CAUD|nr:hypothetical protein PP-LUZ7_gp013 [Pseudomonas phage LUZ7]CAZ66154.1 hypothetical protein [Pseudomonas phage LUZ7]
MHVIQLVYLLIILCVVLFWVGKMEPERCWGWVWWTWLTVFAVLTHAITMVAVGIIVLFIVP